MPTLLDLLAIKPPPNIDGISLKELILSNTPLPKERTIVTEMMPDRLAFRINNWKLIRKEGDSALYNLKSDPGEKNNLIDKPAAKEIQESLLKKLRDWQAEHIAKRGDWIKNTKPNTETDEKLPAPDAPPAPLPPPAPPVSPAPPAPPQKNHEAHPENRSEPR
jgi:hypothetical protein